MLAFVTYPHDRFAIVAGEPASYRSSDRAVRQFCASCGSALFWIGDERTRLDVTLGSLDRPEAMPPPAAELWAAQRLPWLPTFAGMRVAADPVPGGAPRPTPRIGGDPPAADAAGHTGGCLCGAIRFRLSGQPVRVVQCHRTMCRRQSGAPAAVFAIVRRDRLEVLAGAPVSYRSSATAVRQFCPACGSFLFFREDAGDELDVSLGVFDWPERVPAPTYEIWARHRLPWYPEMPELIRYAGERDGPATRPTAARG